MLKTTKLFFLIILVSLLLITLTGCDKSQPKDSRGIVVTSPEVAETIAKLGGIDLIIGRTQYCDYPQEMHAIESVGDFSSLDIERVISLKPSIIFTAAFEQQDFFDKLKPFGIEVIKIHSNSINSYLENIQLLANKLELQDNAEQLINDFKTTISNITLPAKSPKVYFEISPNLGTITDNSFIGDLIVKAGGTNIFGQLNKDFLIAKNEEIVAANPDIIIALSYASKEEIIQRKGWQSMEAVKNARIYTIADVDLDTVMRTVPRSLDALKVFNQWFLEYAQD